MSYKSADFIRQKRKSLGISLRKLARMCEMPPSTLSDIENSKFKIKPKYIKSISKYLMLSNVENDQFKYLITIDRSDLIDDVINFVAEEPEMYKHAKLVYDKSRVLNMSKKKYSMLNHFLQNLKEASDVNNT